MTPVVLINTKTYAEGTGSNAVKLANICAERGAWIALQPTDIQAAATNPKAKVFAQHIDPVSYGAHTGSITAEAVKAAGATGTILNHSEHRLPPKSIAEATIHAKKLGLQVIICAANNEEALNLAALKPDYIALEIPELIGGDKSIVEAEPETIQTAIQTIPCPVLVGAGINSNKDLVKALEYGAHGVLLASAVVKKTSDPARKLDELYGTLR